MFKILKEARFCVDKNNILRIDFWWIKKIAQISNKKKKIEVPKYLKLLFHQTQKTKEMVNEVSNDQII